VLITPLWLVIALAQPRTPTLAPRDTSLYENTSHGDTLRQHGDTVWSISPRRTTRIVDTGREIHLWQTERSGVAREARWEVRDGQAFPLGGRREHGVPVERLRGLQRLIASSKRVDALQRR
jgi:hypothetical protein